MKQTNRPISLTKKVKNERSSLLARNVHVEMYGSFSTRRGVSLFGETQTPYLPLPLLFKYQTQKF